MKILLKNGYLYTNKKADVLIENGKISKVGTIRKTDAKVIDIKDKYILPGVIDINSHLSYNGKRLESWDTFSQAALKGGVTSSIINPINDCVTEKELKKHKKEAKDKSLINYGFVFHLNLDNIDLIDKLKNDVFAYKISLCGPHYIERRKHLEDIFSKVSSIGKILYVHPEIERVIQERIEHNSKRNDILVHADSRPAQGELKAIELIYELVNIFKTRTHINCLSTKKALDLLKKRNRPLLTFDVAPHHIFFTRQDLFKQGNLIKSEPPLRSVDDQESLWKGVVKNTVDILASDHHSHLKKEKLKDDAPAGMPHIETILPLLLNELHEKKIRLDQIVNVLSIKPSKLLNIANKGDIKEGYDADLVIVDLNLKQTISNKSLVTKAKWSPFEGKEITGWPIMTFVNGVLMYNKGKFYKKKPSKELI